MFHICYFIVHMNRMKFLAPQTLIQIYIIKTPASRQVASLLIEPLDVYLLNKVFNNKQQKSISTVCLLNICKPSLLALLRYIYFFFSTSISIHPFHFKQFLLQFILIRITLSILFAIRISSNDQHIKQQPNER